MRARAHRFAFSLLAPIFGIWLNTASAQVVSLPATSISFGSVVVGTTATRNFSIKNTGTSNLVISRIIAAGSYQSSNCGSATIAPQGTCTATVTFTPTVTGSNPGSLTITDNASDSPQVVTLSGSGILAATLSAASLTFPNQAVGTTGAAFTITLTNNQSVVLNITSVTTTGDFAATSCATPLAAHGICVISVTFTPSVVGTRTGTLTVNDNANNSPQTASLSGSGVQPVTLSPATGISFPSQALNTTSSAKTVTLANNQSVPLNISKVTTSGAYNASSCPATLAAQTSCVISVTFTPTAPGTSLGTLTVVDNANNSPQTASLSGSGVQPVTLSLTSLNFASQAVNTTSSAKTVTLTNNQSVPLNISSITTSANFAASSCATPIAPNGSCVISVTFTPSTTGNLTGTLTVADSANPSPQTLGLTGTGSLSVSLAPATLQFSASQVVGTTSPAQTVSLSNNQSTALSITSVATTGPYAASTCPASLAPGATCIISVTFTPTAVGHNNGSLTVVDTSGQQTSTLQGTGAAVQLTSITVAPANPSPALGTKQQLTATGNYNNGTAVTLSTATWTSSATNVATVNTAGLVTTVATGVTTITAASGGVSGSATLTVKPPALVSIAVTPPNPAVASGTTQQFTATGTYTDGSTNNLTQSVTWKSSNTAIATLTAGGLATSIAVGPATVTATLSSVAGATILSVTPAVLASITLTPLNPSAPLGATQQFTATGTFTDGTTQNLTASATWSSSSPATASISSSGLALGLGQGTTMVSAVYGSVTGTDSFTVTAAVLTSITVNPSNPSIALGTTQQLTATGTFTDGSTQNLTSTATWTSATTSVAAVSATGLAASASTGTTLISAASGSIVGSTSLNVTSAALASIMVSPNAGSIGQGTTQQFMATGVYTDGTTQDLTATAYWTSSAAGVATISDASGSQGLATGAAVGTTIITASAGTISGTANLTVTPAALLSIAVAPVNASIPLGATQPFTATGTYSDGTTKDLTSTATWTSSTATVAPISSTGLASSAAVGTTTITATSGSVSGSTTLTIIAPVLSSITVTPANPSVPLELSVQFTATGTFSDGSTQDFTNAVLWASSTAVGSISSSGLATATALGQTTITATSGSVSGATTLTVIAPVVILSSITVTPANPSTPLGTPQQFMATGNYSNGTTADLTGTVSWASSAPSVATINSAGLAMPLVAGATTISATSGAISGSTTWTVNPPALVSLAVTPANPSIASGTTQQFVATGTYTDGSTHDLSNAVTWSSSNTSAASITSTGLATGAGVSTATITATSGSVSGATILTVTPAVLTTITLTPLNPSAPLGATQQFTATGTFTDGTTQDLTASATWSSSSPATASISSSGLAVGLGQGTTTISAVYGSVTGTDNFTVTAAVLTAITVNPSNPSIALGTTQQLTATGTFTDGTTQNLTSSATWTSATTSVAAVSATGLAASASTGTTTISATSGSIVGSTILTVTPAALVSIAVSPNAASLPLGATQQLVASGTYTDGSTQDLTPTAYWTSTFAGVATVSDASGSQGLATTVGVGATTITATSGSISGSTTLTVTPAALLSLAVAPASASIPLGATQPFTATGTYSDGTTKDLTSTATWTSSTATVAPISSTGLASSAAVGTTTITATSSSVSGSTTLTIIAPVLSSITVMPANPSVPLELSVQFTATGTFTDGTQQDLTASVTWTSSTTAALVGSSGLASTAALGATVVTATLGSVSGFTTLTVTPPVLVSIVVTPANASIPLGTIQQLAATGIYTDGSQQNLTGSAAWISANTAVADVNIAGLVTTAATGATTITGTSGGVSGSTTLTVNPPALVSIAVTPSNPAVASGTTQQFTATGTYTDGSTNNLTQAVTWKSSNTAIATLTAGGLATSIAVGPATVTATSGSVAGATILSGTPAVLASITLTPLNPSAPLGATQQFTATGTFTDGTTQNLTASATWSSSSPATGSISSSGLAMGLGQGSTTISAVYGSVTGTDNFTVTAAVLTAITVNPSNSSIALGTTQQLTATGTFTDGTTQNLTSTATWTSATTSVAAVSATGLAASASTGTTLISAASGSIVGSTSLNVTSAALASIMVSPNAGSIGQGTTQQFTATGVYTDGTTQDLTATAYWTSSAAGVATISDASGSQGLATGAGVGTTIISANAGPTTGTASLNVTSSPLVSITVGPANPSIPLGTTQQFSAIGNYANGSTSDLSSTAVWTSSTAPVAPVNSTGLASSASMGSTMITATFGSISGSTLLTVTAAVLNTITVTPANSLAPLGISVQFTATGTFTDGTQQDLTASATWTSSTTAAMVGSSGLASTAALGATVVTATLGSVSGGTTLTVTPPALVSIVVTPANASIPLGTTQQLAASGIYTDGSQQNLTGSVAWISANPSVAAVSATGMATSIKTGSTTITAGVGSFMGAASLTISAPALVSIAVAPALATVPLDTSAVFTATGTFSDGSTQILTNGAVTWSAGGVVGGNSTFGTIAGNGLYNAPVILPSPFQVVITATSTADATKMGSTTVSLSQLAVNVFPLTPQVQTSATLQFTATVNGSSNVGVTWRAGGVPGGNSTVGTISASGLYSAPAIVPNPAQVAITATSVVDGVTSGSTTLTVVLPITVTVSPATTQNVHVNSSLHYTATVTGSSNHAVTWSAGGVVGGNIIVGTVSSSGVYTAPPVVPPYPSQIMITATSVADPTSSASGIATVMPVAATSVTVSPETAWLQVGSTLQFSPAVSDNSNQHVTWSVNGVVNGNSTIGTINSSGLYTAPSVVPNPAQVVVTATSVADTTKSGNATVTLARGPFSATPLTDLAPGQLYLGQFSGMLYNGSNSPPLDHDAAGQTAAAAVQPLDANGNPSPNGEIVLISLGMSNGWDEWCDGFTNCTSYSFEGQAATSSAVNHTTLAIANGAFPGQTASSWACASGYCPLGSTNSNDYDRVRDTILTPAGLTERQVQVVWIKQANPAAYIFPSLPSNSADAYDLEYQLGQIVRALKIRWPNVQQVFISNRIYAGYAAFGVNPEPYAYESGFSVKWLVSAQIAQRDTGFVDPIAGDLLTEAPWISWGPYIWGNGTNNPPGSTALTWLATDYSSDGQHPGTSGVTKVGTALMNFFLTSPYTTWFRK